MKNTTTTEAAPEMHAAWRARLGLETGGPGWHVAGPPEPLAPASELALLAVRQMRSDSAADLVTLNSELGQVIGALDPVGAKRDAFRAAIAAASTPVEMRPRRKRTPLRWIGGRIEASA